MELNDSQLAALEKDLAADLAAIARVRKLMHDKSSAVVTSSSNHHEQNGSSDDSRKSSGEVGDAVIEAIKHMKGDFTAKHVDESIELALGKSFERSSIRSALGRLLKDASPIFAVKEQGKGRKATVYKRLTLF